ncbi:MAG: DHH family phosphoesterase [Patescibacteria group bacterium]
MNKFTAEKIHEHLMNASRIIIIPHPNPDEDALGSASAVHEYLNSLGRQASIYCATPANPRLKYLPSMPAITNDARIFTKPDVDTIVFVDCGDPRYAGVSDIIKNHPATIINIDHHATNENYGAHNLVMTRAAATAEILFKFFDHNRINVSRHMATNLLAGIITDTGNFTNSATTPSAMAIAGELVRRGANYKLINYFTQKDKNFKLLRLWGLALSRLEKIEEHGLVYTHLKQSDFQTLGLNESDAEGISDFMNNIDDAKILLTLKETAEGKIKGSFRTTVEGVDVAAMAKQLGGGGHKKAAGFTADGTVEEVIERILTLNAK